MVGSSRFGSFSVLSEPTLSAVRAPWLGLMAALQDTAQPLLCSGLGLHLLSLVRGVHLCLFCCSVLCLLSCTVCSTSAHLLH